MEGNHIRSTQSEIGILITIVLSAAILSINRSRDTLPMTAVYNVGNICVHSLTLTGFIDFCKTSSIPLIGASTFYEGTYDHSSPSQFLQVGNAL